MVRNDFDTLSEAMNSLKKQGYEKDLTEDILKDAEGKYFIVKSYRFEGMTNPGDSSVLYAIESNTGKKGIIVDAYSAKSDLRKTEALNKIRNHPSSHD